MKNKNILFRADSSSTIGTGHIMRDLVLAKQYSDANVIFVTQNLDGNINHKILESNYKIEIVKSNEIEELINLIKKYNASLIVIDHYGIDYKYEQMLKEKTGVKILSFDDTYEKHHCDIVLNHNISGDTSRYKNLVPKECEIRCGVKYTLLRDEFYQEFPQKIQSDIKTILIAMGGADSRNLNKKIVQSLASFKNIKIEIITTTSNKYLKELEIYLKDKTNTTLHINSNEVAKLMHKSDLVIITPSVSVNEAYFMKVPFIAIKTEENQQEVYNYLKKNNFLVIDEFDEQNLIKDVQLLLNTLDVTLINFIDLSEQEKINVLEYRNHQNIRKWMYNQKKITLQNHLNYIETLKIKNDRIYFLVRLDGKDIGVVDLTNIKKATSAELGIYANPSYKGFGTILIHMIVRYAFDQLYLEKLYANVYTDNIRAIELYKRFNFKVIKISKDENREFYNMELANG